VAAVPTPAWAAKVFPDAADTDAVDLLWRTVFQVCRVDVPDPNAAWLNHDATLGRIIRFLSDRSVRSVRFVDSEPGADGKPRTDLLVGLTDEPVWLGAAAVTPDGTVFFPNMPTEEVFTTPHRLRTEGWARTSKPAYPFERQVEDAYFRFVDGEVIEYHSAEGKEVLDQFFAIEGAKRLGEIALVDITSPINRTGLMFHETLYDENAACHIAFGNAYPDGVRNGSALSDDELVAAGANQSPSHLDVMIGTGTMNVYAECADGSTVIIMENGRFAASVTGGGQDDVAES
jgi:aminopeptidase